MRRFKEILLANNNKGRVVRNTFYLLLSEVFIKAIGMVWIIFLARNLSVSDYGRYSLVNSFIALFTFLPDLGVGLIVIRQIAQNKERAGRYLSDALLLNSILGIVTFFVIVISAFLFSETDARNILIAVAAFTLFISTLRSVGIFYFDGMEKMRYSAFLNSLNTLLLIGFAFALLQWGFGLQGVFLGMFGATLVSLVVTWGFVLRKIRFVFKPNIEEIKGLLKEGLPLGLAGFASIIYSRIDTVLLGKLLDDNAVGIYSAATPFVIALVQLLNVPFVVAIYPALSRLYNQDHERFKKAFYRSMIVIALWSFPAAILISISSSIIIPNIFGQKYLESTPILSKLIYAVPFISLSALLYKVLIVIGKQKYYLLISIFGAILNVVLNLLLIPVFGLVGAAIASVVSQGILFLIYGVLVVYHIKRLDTGK